MPSSNPIPLLIFGDSVGGSTGLGRIAGALATGVDRHLRDLFRVGTMGYGGIFQRRFDFPQYPMEGMKDWVVPTLLDVWRDFAGGERGIVLTIWDASRLAWFAQPGYLGRESLERFPGLRAWLAHPPFERWGYFPIDAHGPNRKLSFPLLHTIQRFDRILAYGQWAEDLIRRSFPDGLPLDRLDHLPHGVDTSVFFERDRVFCRAAFGQITGAKPLAGPAAPLQPGELLLGIVATNQRRKDWALGIETASLLARTRKVRLWIHTDVLERECSIPGLLIDYGLVDKALVSLGNLRDEEMAQAYSACDLTLGIGRGEGWGYPLAESLACGTPVLHGDYAGGAEIVPASLRIAPLGFHAEGLYGDARPVFRAEDWAARALEVAGQRAALDPQFAWDNLWPRWEAWFRAGAEKLGHRH